MDTNIKNVTRKYIQNSISDYIRNEIDINCICKELNTRCNNMIKSIEKKDEDLSIFSNIFLGFLSPDSEKVDKRIKYMYNYITYAKKQIDNLKWIEKNKSKFNLTNEKLYKLSLFKEKLSKENAIYLPFK